MLPFLSGGATGIVEDQAGSSVSAPAHKPGGIGWRVFLGAAVILVGSMMACSPSMFAVTPEFGRFACGNWVVGILVIAGILGTMPLLSIRGVVKQQAAYEAMMERARARWSRLYYCARDDVAFDPFGPDGSTVIPVPALGSYLYS